MKQHRQSRISINWFVAAGLALASAGALAGDVSQVTAGGRSVSEVQGRASGSPSGAGVQLVRADTQPSVAEVVGRGNQMAKNAGTPIAAGTTDIGDFGRSSMVLAKTTNTQGKKDVTLATTK